MPTTSQTQQQQQANNTNGYVKSPENLGGDLQNQRTRSTSLGENAARMERQITMMQTRNAADEALMARLKHVSEENRLAMDGYKDNVYHHT